MRILELQLKHFGKFTQKQITFQEGINVICGENEMGKTTMHSFIRAMLFGIQKGRGRAAKKDEYSLRQPWENGSYYEGVLRLESGGKIFRLERNFYKREESASLICETDGEELSLEDGDLDVLLEGMSQEAFVNTVFIRQEGGMTDQGLAAELRNFMNNLQNTGDGQIHVNQALASLEKRQKELEAERKRQLAGSTKQLQEIQMRLDYATQELDQCRQQLEECRIRKGQAQKELESMKGERKSESKRSVEPRQYFLLCVLGLLALLGSVFVPGIGLKIVLLLAWLLLFGLFILNGRKKKEEKAESGGRDDFRQAFEKIEWEEERLLQEQRERRTLRDNLLEAREEMLGEQAKKTPWEKDANALRLASETIRSISEEIYKESAQGLNRRISQILGEITGGKYDSVFLDADMQVKIHTPQKLLSLEQISRGTMEQVYFALRMAAGELLSGGAPMPVILDDAFVMYDDERLARTLAWLQKSGRQVILFTCQSREKILMESSLHAG